MAGRGPYVAALLLMLVPSPLSAAPAAEPQWASPEAIFLSEIIVLLVCGRLLGEVMQRIGQPAVMGQLIAGILLGPSVLGALWPDLQQSLFPHSREQKAMIDAVSQLGILMLLLLTGMETDLSVVQAAGPGRGQRFDRRHQRALRLRLRCSASCCPKRCCRRPISA